MLMARVSGQIQINVPKDKVWEIIADFGNAAKWAPIVTQSAIISSTNQGVGTERSCEVQQFGSVTEKVLDWDEGNSIRYEVKGSPLLNSLINELSLRGEADQTIVTVEGEADIPGTEAERKGFQEQLNEPVQISIQGLKQYAETGQKMAPPAMS